MNVAIVQSTPAGSTEGIGTHTLALARQLRRRGHEPHLFTRGGWTGSTDTVDGIPVTRPACPPLYPLHAHLHRFPLQRALDRAGPFDLVHLHSPLVPYPAVDAPTVGTIHTPIGPDVASVPQDAPGKRRLRLQVPFSKALEQTVVRKSDAVTCVSESNRELLAAQYDRAIEVVHNGVDADEFDPAFDGRDPATLLYVGRLGRRKGLVRLLDVATRLRDRGIEFTLDVVGTGPLRETLEREIADRDLGKQVELHGFVDRAALRERLRRATVLVHLPEFEGLPTTVLEAMASGTPVVATDVPGCRDAIDDGATGLLVEKADVPAIADAVADLLSDPARQRKLGQTARRRVEENFDWAQIASDYERVYEQVLE